MAKHEESGKKEIEKDIVAEILKIFKEYVFAIVSITGALFYLNYIIEKQPAVYHKWKWIILSCLFCIFLMLYFFNIRPAIRKRRAKNLKPIGDSPNDYFITSPRTNEDKYNLFDSGYENFLKWAAHPKASLLYLTGDSGSGKSSVITAFLKPCLEKGIDNIVTQVVSVRTYHNPLKELIQALHPHVLEGHNDFTIDETFRMLQEAAVLLSANERLLIVFDQFEEFILLHEDKKRTLEREKILQVENTELNIFREFMQRFLKETPAKITIMLSYREDYQQLVERLNLPPRNELINWMQLSPLPFAKAEKFLRNCPDLEIPEERIERVLDEAARHETGRVVVRPIVINILGLVLQRMSGHPTAWKQEKDLLRHYVLQGLGRELPVERASVLREMLTDFHTARPRTIAELSQSCSIDAKTLDIQLQHMAQHGLVRCLDTAELTERRKWQISHDFLAALIERVVHGIRPGLWQTLRPMIAPLLVVILVTVSSVYYQVLKKSEKLTLEKNAINALADVGLIWNEKNKTVTARGENIVNNTISSEKFHSIIPFLQILLPDTLKLIACTEITNLNGLESVKSLKSVYLTRDYRLENIDGLAGLISLEELNLSADVRFLEGSFFSIKYEYDFVKIDSVITSTIGKLKNLKHLNLSERKGIKNVDFLNGLTNLTEFYISNCYNLNDLIGLKSVKKLTHLDLSYSKSLTNINGLNELINLTSVDLSNCKRIQSVSMWGLKNLKELELYDCDSLVEISNLNSLPDLITLDLSNCKSLKIVTGMKGLSKLETLNLSNCGSLKDFSGLSSLVNLKKLDLDFCDSLTEIPNLNELSNLVELNLSNCKSLSNINGLKGLRNLRTLYLENCKRLKTISGLEESSKLEILILDNCVNLENIESILNLKSLKTLDIRNCNKLSKSEVNNLQKSLPKTKIYHDLL